MYKPSRRAIIRHLTGGTVASMILAAGISATALANDPAIVGIPGRHVLVDRQLIVDCGPAPGPNAMQLHRLSLRRLTRFDLLTRREQEVASLLADGKSHKEAARILSVAPATIRNQTQSIYSKMGVASRAELAVEVNRGRAG